MADASSEPKLNTVETDLATKPLHGGEKKEEGKEAPAAGSVCTSALDIYWQIVCAFVG